MLQEISIEAIAQRKKSEALFIFGSGYSIRDLTPVEIEKMEQQDTLSFNWFIYQEFLRMDYHLIREIASDDVNPSIWKEELCRYSEQLKKNPFYQDTIFLLQIGWNAMRMAIHGYLPDGAQCLLYSTNREKTKYPVKDFKLGLVHGPSTLFDSINFAYLFGWKKIILVGVDLYDRRYFWLKKEETRHLDLRRNKTCRDIHNTARETVIWAKRWHNYLRKKGVELFVYNPKSLLAKSMPVFAFTRRNQ